MNGKSFRCLYSNLSECQLNNKYSITFHVDNVKIKAFGLGLAN